MDAVGVGQVSQGELTDGGLTVVSLGGYLNGESFQVDGVLSHNGYQYTAFWGTARAVVLARRALPAGNWQAIELADYVNVDNDARSAISLGICPGDGTLHLAFDNNQGPLHYRKSVAGLVTNPATATWAASSFSAVTGDLMAGIAIQNANYPGFVTEPGGTRMLMALHTTTSAGSGDETLWEYDGATHAWTSVGIFLNGTASSLRAYFHGLSFTKAGSRLHVSWSWRSTSDEPSTNHDLLYAYSDDNGRTWKNNAGALVATAGSAFINGTSAGIKVWTVGQNRGLINSEHMAVDSSGRVHVLLSHLPDAQPDDSVFDSARGKSQYFHYWRNTAGTWARTAMGVNAVAAFRGKLAVSSMNNLYAVLPDLNIAAASSTANFAPWIVLRAGTPGRFFSDPLLDSTRLLTEDKLTVVYPEKGSPTIDVLDFTIR